MNKVPLPLLDLKHVMRNFGLIFSPYKACVVICANRITIKYMQYWSPLLVKVLVCLIFDNWKKKERKNRPVHLYYSWNIPFLANLFTDWGSVANVDVNDQTTTCVLFNSGMFSGMLLTANQTKASHPNVIWNNSCNP